MLLDHSRTTDLDQERPPVDCTARIAEGPVKTERSSRPSSGSIRGESARRRQVCRRGCTIIDQAPSVFPDPGILHFRTILRDRHHRYSLRSDHVGVMTATLTVSFFGREGVSTLYASPATTCR